ncbi:unnamed protein product [Brassica oleracea]
MYYKTLVTCMSLYIFDTENELQNRKRAITEDPSSLALDDSIIVPLIEMLDIHNHLARTFRHASYRYKATGSIEFSITLVRQPNRGRQYDLPTANEIGGLIVGDLSATSVGKDIVVELKSSALQRISDLHPLLMSLQYPLLFPDGDTGYHERLPYCGPEASTVRREYMTMREFYAYQIQTRPSEGMTIIKGGKLFHQYIVDAYVATETERLRFISLNQKKLRADLYNNVCDARNYVELHIFITIIIIITFGVHNSCRKYIFKIFFLKLYEIFKNIISHIIVAVYTIEFQKRGLPHAHILLWLKGIRKDVIAAMIDEYISAEFPDKEVDREGFELVERHMIHGPCGRMRPKSPCMDKGECTKNFPKPLSEHTRIDKSGFVVYRRRSDDTSFVVKNDIQVDNRFVVPHNLGLLKKYQAHINVEWCAELAQ